MITLIDKYKGRTIFTASEAAEILGMPHQTFKYAAYTKKSIVGRMVGSKRCYTLEQLEDFHVRGYTSIAFVGGGFYTSGEAAIYLNMPTDTLGYYAHTSKHAHLLKREVVGRKSGKRGGGVIIYRKNDLDSFRRDVLEVNSK